MEQNDLNKIQRELEEIKENLKISISESKRVERIDYSLFKIQRLLDPRPPISKRNYCSYCGKKINDNITGFDTDDNFLDMS